MVHRPVGGLEQLLAVAIAARAVEHGHADRERGFGLSGRQSEDVVGHGAAQSLGDGHDGTGVGLGQEDGELVAAVAAENVGASQLGGDHGRQVAEHFVGRVVAERVVDGLEAVQVEEDDAQCPVRYAGLGEEVIELLAEGAHVVEAGQTVAVCELLEPLGTLFQLGPFPL